MAPPRAPEAHKQLPAGVSALVSLRSKLGFICGYPSVHSYTILDLV